MWYSVIIKTQSSYSSCTKFGHFIRMQYQMRKCIKIKYCVSKAGLYPTFYESEEQLRKISNACEKFKITSLWFIGFNELKVSNQTVTRIFHNQQINIRIVTNYPKVGKQVQKDVSVAIQKLGVYF